MNLNMMKECKQATDNLCLNADDDDGAEKRKETINAIH